MLFQLESLIFILGLIIGTIVVTLVIYIAVTLIESKHKASDKKLMILLLAFLAVLVLPIVVGAIGYVLSALGNVLILIRFDGGGRNMLVLLVPVIFFLLLLVMVKYLIDVTWEVSVWVSLLTLFVLYILFSLVPELTQFIPLA